MNELDKQYQTLLQDILDTGVRKEDRTGTGTLSVFGRQIRHRMSEGFPLITTKKMYWKGIVTELLWFLRGDTNIKYLVDNDCHIWDGDAYKRYLVHTIEGVNNGFDKIKGYLDDCLVEFDGEYEHFNNPSFQYGYRPHTQEEFINKIKTDDSFAKKWGDLGPVYGKQWRGWVQNVSRDLDRQIDQFANLIRDLKTNPDSRRLMVTAWNVAELDKMTLPPCHYGFQVYTRELSLSERQAILEKRGYRGLLHSNVKNYKSHKKILEVIKQTCDAVNIPTRAISLMWNQRSVDTFLGLPFNIASYGLLLEIIAKEVNMVPDELIGNLGDTHLYLNHIEQAKEQIGREFSLEERNGIHKNLATHMRYRIDKLDVLKKLDYDGGLITHEILDELDVPTRTREPFPLPKLIIDQFDETNHYIGDMDDVSEYNIEQFKLEGYQSHPTIKAALSN